MLWVLWDIVLPLLATFLLGLLVGWLLWRWRRSRIDAEDLSKLRRTSARYSADVERLQQSNSEFADRLQAAGNNESGSARKQIDRLTEELNSSRREVAELKSASYAGDADRNLAVELGQARNRIAELENSLAQNAGNLDSVDSDGIDLRAELAARDRMITTLEKSLKQFGESGDTTALMADIAIRDRKIEELETLVATLNLR